MPKISVIVPVYNVKQYIRGCVESVLCQTYKDFELILIDDGSSDGSGSICDELAGKDSRILVYHQKNGGVSSARNYGISKAMGDWLCFIDSDDTVEKDYLSSLVNSLTHKENCDISLCGYRGIFDDAAVKDIHRFELNEETIDIVKVIKLAERANIINSPVCKLFRTDLIKRHQILFDTQLSYGEDHLFVLDYFQFVNSAYISSSIAYNYFHRGNTSLTSTGSNVEKFVIYAENLANSYHKLRSIINSETLNRLFDQQLHEHIVRALFYVCISTSDIKRGLFHRLYIESYKIGLVKPESLFYSAIWQSLRFPENVSFFIVKILCKLKQFFKNNR